MTSEAEERSLFAGLHADLHADRDVTKANQHGQGPVRGGEEQGQGDR